MCIHSRGLCLGDINEKNMHTEGHNIGSNFNEFMQAKNMYSAIGTNESEEIRDYQRKLIEYYTKTNQPEKIESLKSMLFY